MTRPRIRTIKPEIWQDEKVGQLSRDARLLFIGLITMADDIGRLRAMTPAVLGHVFPYDLDAARKIEKWFGELENQRLVRRYEVDGVLYAELPGWPKHQRVNRPSESELPAPLNGHRIHYSLTESSRNGS